MKLDKEAYVGSVDGGRPPEREATVGDLVETGSLGVGELLVLHAFLETGGLLPEETFPRGEVGALEQGVLQNTFHAAQSLPRENGRRNESLAIVVVMVSLLRSTQCVHVYSWWLQ